MGSVWSRMRASNARMSLSTSALSARPTGSATAEDETRASVESGAVRRAADAVGDDVREQDLGDCFRGGHVVAEVLERCAEGGLEVRAVVCGGLLIEGRLRCTLVKDGVDGGPTHPIDLAARRRAARADRPGPDTDRASAIVGQDVVRQLEDDRVGVED